MHKASLTASQRGYSLASGAIAHVLFSLGWLILGIVALGGGLTLVLNGTAAGVGGVFGDIPALKNAVANVGDVISAVIAAFAVVALILVAAATAASLLLLRRGAVRKPWRVTFLSLAIVAALDVPLFFVYVALASEVTDTTFSGPLLLGPVLGIVGSAILGALVWWWMAWLHRGSASKFAGVTASASANVVPQSAVEDDSAGQATQQ